ncbi:MAG: hypothetical protein LUG12_13735 [Erysipelotrichaceae bacterium]|nr:hypothetical protein [Erysipelotrichaceae bacterium]
MYCINMCDIFHMTVINENQFASFMNYLIEIMPKKPNRIYMGSYFCSQYFLRFNGYLQIIEYCQNNNLHITLVIPILSQKDLKTGKKRIENICQQAGNVIDEITVNDIGMLKYFQNKNYQVNLGRLFFKTPRDCRVSDYTNATIVPELVSNLNLEFWQKENLNDIELDPTNKSIDISILKENTLSVGLHIPYCYMTTGNICKFASIHKDIEYKFRANATCRLECMHIYEAYNGHNNLDEINPTIERYGRTLFFKNEQINVIGNDISKYIYFPIKEWRNYLYENTSST